ADLDERKLRRATIVAVRKPHGVLQAPAQHDHAPLPAPARQPNLALLRLEALAGANPFARAGELLDHAFDVGGQAQLEQEGKSARLGLAHDPLVAETAIATQQGWPEVARQAIEQRPQARRTVLGGMFVAGTDVDIENKTRRGHRIGVIAMARTPRLLGIVARVASGSTGRAACRLTFGCARPRAGT